MSEYDALVCLAIYAHVCGCNSHSLNMEFGEMNAEGISKFIAYACNEFFAMGIDGGGNIQHTLELVEDFVRWNADAWAEMLKEERMKGE